MKRQILQCPSQSVITRLIRRQRSLTQTRQQFVPHQIQNGLQIANAAGDGDDCVLFWQNDAELTVRAVAAKSAVATAPELITVTLIPIALWVTAVCNLKRRRRLDPRLGNQLLPLPLPFLQVEQSKTRDVFCANAESK